MTRFALLSTSAVGLLMALGATPADALIAPNGGAAIDETATGIVTLAPVAGAITANLTSKTEGPLDLGSPITGNLGTGSGATGFVPGALVNGGANLVIPYVNGAITPIAVTIGTLTFTFNTATETPPTPPVATTATTPGSFQIDIFGNLTGDTSNAGAGTFVTGALGSGISPASFSETCTQTTLAAPVSCSDTLAVSSVPEPASLTLLGSALVGMGWLARRRRKSL